MKNITKLLIAAVAVLLFTTCTKEKLPEFYFRCKVDGRDFKPDNCTNCSLYEVYGDTMISIGGNMGWETVAFLAKEKVRVRQNFALQLSKFNNNTDFSVGQGTYRNGIAIPLSHYYRTDSIKSGILNVMSIDRTNRIIEGNFHFTAYSPGLNRTVNVTDGKFRVRYTPN
jgi:hypothetical protein